MKKVINPWRGMEGYHCFGCAPDNASGLRMEFYEDGDEIVSVWAPRPEFQGWINTLHGGIQAALADEICAWVITRKFQTSGVTASMELRYRKPMHTTDRLITLRARVAAQKRNVVDIEAELRNEQGEICTTARCRYFIFPQEQAKKEFSFFECGVEEEESSPTV